MSTAQPNPEIASPPNAHPIRSKKTRPLRILYLDGPGDVLGTFHRWREGQHDPNEVCLAYSEEFFSVTQDLNARSVTIATHDTFGFLHHGNCIVLHCPVPTRARGGLAYHYGEIGFAFWLIRTANRFSADVLVVGDRVHWFALWPARLFGIRILAVLHNTLWPRGLPAVDGLNSTLTRLNRLFWRTAVESMLCVSPEVERQYRSVMRFKRTAYQVRPQYLPELFANIPPPPPKTAPLQCFFAGRMEKGKGIFDLIELAVQLHRDRPGDFQFELAGTGPAFDDLQREVLAYGLQHSIRLLGRLDMHAMAAAYGRCHAVIVPTNAGFAEGLNKVCVEAILAGRPVITSAASPAIDVLTDAVLEVPIGDIDAYAQALMLLKDDPALYTRLAAATAQYATPFYDRSQGYRAALHRALLKLPPNAPLPSQSPGL